MSTGLLTPDARLRIVNGSSLIVPGAKLHTYVAGTPSTPLATTSDAAGLVPNLNPVVASAGGLFGPIYLTKGVAYKLVLTDASDVELWSQDNVSVPNATTLAAGTGITLGVVGDITTINATAGLSSIGVDDFRLTLESGVPASSSDQLAKGTLFCTPAIGNRIDLYDAAGVPTRLTSLEFSIPVPAAVSTVFSVFVYNNAGVPTLELAAWTNDTTPGPAAYSYSAVTGTRTKTGDLTRRFRGLLRSTTVANQAEDSFAKRYVWNESNRVPRLGRVVEATDSWAYTTATLRQANGNTANQLDFLVGDAGDPVMVAVRGFMSNGGGTSSDFASVGIGEDSTTTLKTGTLVQRANLAITVQAPTSAELRTYPAIGRHVYTWLEISAAIGASTWFGDAGAPNTVQAGIHGWVMG